MKDVSKYVPIFSKPGVLNMELNNVLDDRYTGLFASALFFCDLTLQLILMAFHYSQGHCNFLPVFGEESTRRQG